MLYFVRTYIYIYIYYIILLKLITVFISKYTVIRFNSLQ